MPLPSLIVDLDLTLSDSRWRERLPDTGRKTGWDEFHRHAGADDPVEQILGVVVALQKRMHILILTSRPISIETATLAWLSDAGVRPSLVLMREDDDSSGSADLKRRQLAHARSLGYDPRLAIDDDGDVTGMYIEEGLVVLQPHLPGGYGNDL